MRFLLLEDKAEFAQTVSDELHRRGHEVVCASTVGDAWLAMNDGPYDVLLCDYDLPDGTGIDFLAGLMPLGELTVVWSAVNRDREIAASGIPVELRGDKLYIAETLDRIEEART